MRYLTIVSMFVVGCTNVVPVLPDGGIGDAQGVVGEQGPQGPQGIQGPQGVPGTQGAQGAPGAKGAPGAAGATGPQGAAGPQGLPGNQGPVGSPGATGATGPAGPAGPTGAPGLPGAVGPAGATGPAGTPGAPGAPGAAGSAGPTGATGPAGPMGPSGGAPTLFVRRMDGTSLPVFQLVHTEDRLSVYGINEGATRVVLLEATPGGQKLPVQRDMSGNPVENVLLYPMPGCVGAAYSMAGPGSLVQQVNASTGTLELFRVASNSVLITTIRGYRKQGSGACIGANQGFTVYPVMLVGIFPLTLGDLTVYAP